MYFYAGHKDYASGSMNLLCTQQQEMEQDPVNQYIALL